MLGLFGIFVVTLGDVTGTLVGVGKWLKTHRGPDAAICLIFLFSGLALNAEQLRAGLRDVSGTLLALSLIFVAAPLVASVFVKLPLPTGVRIGLLLVAVMPTTLSSGVVMTAAAGGNMAHALMITILANGLAVVSIPFSLGLLLPLIGSGGAVVIDKAMIMLKIGLLVLLPLAAGVLLKLYAAPLVRKVQAKVQIINQAFILGIVWIALSQTRAVILGSGGMLGGVVVLAFAFHALLLLAGFALTRAAGCGPGRRESVIFMGAQKTLPLSVLLQVSLFPQYGLALVVCVVHHIVHLLMDSYLVGRLGR